MHLSAGTGMFPWLAIKDAAFGWRWTVSRSACAKDPVSLAPVALGWGGVLDFYPEFLDHTVEEIVLVGDVVVQRHPFDAKLSAKLVHAQPA
jgi:hypothetical protein